MLKFVFISIVGLLTSFFASSQEIDPNDLHNLFWKIEHSESKKVSYLFGTIHLIDKDKFLLPKAVKKRITKADALYLEIADLGDKSKAMELSMLKEGSLTDLLTKEQRDSVYIYSKTEFGMDSSMFEKVMGKFKPLVFSQFAMTKLLLSTKSYDAIIGQIADEKQIKKEGFETMEEQFSFFDSMSEELQVELIMQTVRSSAVMDEQWESMQNLYLQQNIAEMVKIGEYSGEMSEFMNSTMMNDRNIRWMSALEEVLPNSNLFIAVGAAHLNGDNGLIHLLSQKGYTLSPISIKLN